MGPWSLGGFYKPLCVLCVAGAMVLFIVGVQPPNDVALKIVPGASLFLAIYWFTFKKRHFVGPPCGDVIRQRQPEIQKAELAIPGDVESQDGSKSCPL